ncbi:MAG: class I SAM-dependent methyltransferase [Candidatus Omnitrophica bacterium]|nr:class I SAM-dependent methyltransferase [Candidatus Omnitrophota bacterium]
MFAKGLRRLPVAEVFKEYARYYDLLYKDKDYVGEIAYIQNFIKKYNPSAKTVLNLGCGTGRHDACLQKMGYEVTGIDLSDTMLVEAKKRAIPGKLEFFQGDVRTVSLKKKFDVVVSLFHVMSYQTADADISAAFKTAAKHLKKGGIFIFDFWNGDGVLKDLPTVRVKRLKDDVMKIVRIAEPVIHRKRKVIDVNYQIIALNKKSGQYSEFYETHFMRYFFLPEIEQALSKTGFSLEHAGAWMSDNPISSAWYGLVLARRIVADE